MSGPGAKQRTPSGIIPNKNRNIGGSLAVPGHSPGAMQIPSDEPPLSYLAYTLPPRPEDVTGDEVLDRFLAYVKHQGLELYTAQEEAILELYADKNVILATPTGSGKSLVALAAHFLGLAQQRRSFYTAPIKALVNEKFFALCRDFGPENVGMLTGDAAVNADAPILCCTQEILSSLALREGSELEVGHVVMDEFHYYADRDRGAAWQIPLLSLPQANFLLMSATFGESTFFEEKLRELTGREAVTVRSKDRPVPLDYDYALTPIHETIQGLIDAGKGPVYVVHFTQKACAEAAQNLTSVDFITKDRKKLISEALRGVRFDSPYAKELQRFLRHGIGLHHAGLLPKYRLVAEKLAQRGLLEIIMGTDTLGVGVNIPIRTVLLTALCKFDGQKTSLLKSRDFHQIVGRAGRRGFDSKGSVVVQAPEHVIENRRLVAKAGSDPVKLKRIAKSKKKPPVRGYVHWDESLFERIIVAPPEPLVSQFKVNHGMLVQVLQRPHGGCKASVELLRKCHEPDRNKRRLRETGKQMFQSLVDAEIVQFEGAGKVVVKAALQEDFSLHRALSLYLVEVLEALDPASPSYGLDVLSMVEAILEDPHMILRKQLDKLKTEKVAELKAAGVEYEQRMEQLDKLECPKPNAELIYDTFNTFAKHHPWVGEENIRPKSVARDMIEKVMGFGETIREYGLERSEGQLLRYLSDVYKTLLQNVPDSAKSEATDEIETFLGAIVRSTDNSLLDEWEAMHRRPDDGEPGEESAATEADRVDVTTDPKAFAVLVRSSVFAVVRALARRDWRGAADILDGANPLVLEQQLAPFIEEFRGIRVDPMARGARFYRVVSSKEPAWIVEQMLCGIPSQWAEHDEDADESGETEWLLRFKIELQLSRDSGRPVLQLQHVGT